MAFYVWTELVCANCSSTTAGNHTSGGINRRQMKSDAKKEGWVFDGMEAFCCKSCKDWWNK